MQDHVARAMPLEPIMGDPLPDPLARLGRVTSATAIIVALVVLAGWALDIDNATSLRAAWPAVTVAGAISLALAGASLSTMTWRLPLAPRALLVCRMAFASLLGLLAIATLTEYVAGIDLAIDPAAQRMAPQSAFCFLLASIGFLARGSAVGIRIRGTAAVAIIAIVVVSLAAYLYGAPALETFYGHTGLPPVTGFALLVIAIGLLASDGRTGGLALVVGDDAGANLARRLLPWTIVIPLALGWLRLRGEQLGYYGTEFGLALFSVSMVFVFTAIVLANARSIGRADRVRQRAMSVLAVSEERFRQMAENIGEAFFVVDIETGARLYVSPTWSDIWGRPPEDAYDQAAWIDSIHLDDRHVVSETRMAARRGERSDWTFRIVRPGSPLRWVRVRAFPVFDSSGKPYRFVGLGADVTELRHSEDRLVQSQKMEAVGRLAGGVAHDFNNLLTVILANAEFLKYELKAVGQTAELIGDIRQAGESAAALTKQLLSFSRRQFVEPVVFPLNEVIESTGNMLRRLIGEDVRLVTKLDPDAGLVRADRGQIEQVLINLAVNARDAMPRGGAITIETRNETLDKTYTASRPGLHAGEYVVAVVSDTGTGMTPEVIEHAFEPFFTTKEAGKGTGLGLATCHGIVQQAGGDIALYSELGIGTTIRVYLPRLSEEEIIDETIDDAALPRGTEAILLVEDEPEVRRVGSRILASLGYRVVAAGDAREALEIAGHNEIELDLLLTDVVLPDVGGRELAQGVVRMRPGTKVLFTSGYTDDMILQHQLLSHDIRLIQKPYTRSSLSRKVREALDEESLPA